MPDLTRMESAATVRTFKKKAYSKRSLGLSGFNQVRELLWKRQRKQRFQTGLWNSGDRNCSGLDCWTLDQAYRLMVVIDNTVVDADRMTTKDGTSSQTLDGQHRSKAETLWRNVGEASTWQKCMGMESGRIRCETLAMTRRRRRSENRPPV